ncbi:3-oxoacyl-[acyl-carrier-protein] synthase 2 [compost metagenome]
MTGHMLGASGAAEAIALVKSLQAGIIPPTINLDKPDPQCDLDYVPHQARSAKLRFGLSNSFGFGGHNSAIVLKAYDDVK